MKTVKVGVLGFGTVGAGTAEALYKNRELARKRFNVDVELCGAADLDITTDRGVDVPKELLTTDAESLISRSDVVVELIGGVTVAKKFILSALSQGKSVVTANKALLALHGEELFAEAEKHNADLLFEASVAGGIPILKSLREGLAANSIKKIFGIMNGTCNYILTRMERENVPFDAVLADAQRLGYAEANPSLDIDGHDTSHKTAILAALAYGRWFGVKDMYIEGLRNLELDEIKYADELGYRIKLLGIIKNEDGFVQMRVHPTLLPKTALLADINDVFNGVMVEGDYVGQTLFYGRGAGRNATASAVAADVFECAVNLANNCVRRIKSFSAEPLFKGVTPIGEIISRYYLRLQVADSIGVISRISAILAEANISISSIMQPEKSGEDGSVPLIILTHAARECDMDSAIKRIEALESSRAKVRKLRIEDI